MTGRTAAVLAGAVVLAAVYPGQAQPAPLPAVVDVTIPDVGTLHVAVPPGYCGYPKAVRDRLSQFLAGGTPSFKLLGIAGNCTGIAGVMQGEARPVSPSLQLTMLASEVHRTARSKPTVYRRWCFEQYPEKGAGDANKDFQEALGELGKGSLTGEAVSLGLLASTRDAVFGGLVQDFSGAGQDFRQVQVVVCFSPADIPVLWTFQEIVGRNLGGEALYQRVRAVLAVAQTQAKITMDLNRQR
jgi:hypothetical protein